MLALSDFFTADEVRAVLGVAPEELEDATLDLDMYARHLEIELSQVGTNLLTDFQTAVLNPAPAALDVQLVAYTKQFALYCIAALVAESSPNFSPRNISDGKGGFIRHADSYKDVLARVADRLRQATERLKTLYSAILGGTSPQKLPTFIGVSTPAYDPITGA